MLTRADLAGEVLSDSFHGGMLQRRSAMMHMGRFVAGLGEAAVRRGAVIFERAPVTERRTAGDGWELVTPRGRVRAAKVLLATGAYTTDAFPWFRRRIVPVGSFLIATRPLTEAEIAATVPGDRTYVTSLNVGNYFRLTPDRRLIWGGRARFSARSDQSSDATERRDPEGEPSRDLPAARRRRDRLLLGRARRHDPGPLSPRRRGRRRLFRDGLLRPRRADRRPTWARSWPT